MVTVVIKPFTAYGVAYVPGELVDSSAIRNEGALIGARFLRPATPDEYNEAMGLTKEAEVTASTPPPVASSSPSGTPTKGKKRRR